MEKLNNFFDQLFKIVPGGIFGLISISIGISIDIIGLIISGYSIYTHSVSSLGITHIGLLFNLGLFFSGIAAVIFDIYLGKIINREIVNEKAIKVTVAISVVSSFSLSLAGVFPLSQESDTILFLHLFFGFTAFIGGLIFIFVYSILMLKDPKFLKILAYIGFIVCGFFAFYLITQLPIAEWLAVFAIILWTLINSLYMIYKKI